MGSGGNAKVYAVFFGFSKDPAGRILSDLKGKCGGVEFVGGWTLIHRLIAQDQLVETTYKGQRF